LDFKTQVFVPHEHDHFRTRLTHTLEVAQIGRTIGRALRLNEDLIEAAALAHDLGHPPFGHAGEAALNDLMASVGGFEHNRQTLRIVEYLEHPYPGFRGLNLTEAVRVCLATHETAYDTPAGGASDTAGPGPLEGQVVDVADEIAYTAADLDDALAAEWIGADDLASLAIWTRAWQDADASCPDAPWIHKRIRARTNVLAMMVDEVIAATASAVAAASIASATDVRDAGRTLVGFSPTFRPDVAALQQMLRDRVYHHPDSRRHGQEGRQAITDLFRHFVGRPEDLPPRYARRIDKDGLHRVVCDYLAGMTDRFCRREHALRCG